ncbi:MAG: hypothetical protein Q9173_006097 [Seirophora scorigena]
MRPPPVFRTPDKVRFGSSVLVPGMKRYYDTGRFTDLTIVCEGHEFQCHKVVVCSQSKFLEAACTNGFQESQSSRIELVDDQACHVSLMLDFLYTQIYPGRDAFTFSELFDVYGPRFVLRTHVSLYVLGDKYGIPMLCTHAAASFAERAESANTADFLKCIPLIYSSVPDSSSDPLRKVVVAEITSRAYNITTSEELANAVRELLHSIEGFREDVCFGLLQKCAVEKPAILETF